MPWNSHKVCSKLSGYHIRMDLVLRAVGRLLTRGKHTLLSGQKKFLKTPEGCLLMVQLVSSAKCRLLPCSVSQDTSVPGGTTAGLEVN